MADNDASNMEEAIEIKPVKRSCRTKVTDFLWKNYLPLSYIFVVVFGSLVPQPGAFIDHKATHYVCVILIFLISGLYLRTNELKDVFVTYKGAIFGIISILGITPVLGGQLTSLLDFSGERHELNSTSGSNMTSLGNGTHAPSYAYSNSVLGPLDYKFGLILFFCMPCTISSGVVMITQLNGHVALAIFLTVVSNIIGIFTVPLYIKWMIASTINVKLDLTSLIFRLTLTLFLPLIVGKLFRIVRRIREFVQPKKQISKFITMNLLNIIVWAKVSTTSLSGLLSVLTVTNALFLIAWSLTVHLVYLLINVFFSWILRLPYEQKKPIIILCSQKTMAVGVSVVTFLPPSIGDQGLMVVAMVIGQITIIVFDSVLVSLWLHYDGKRAKKTEEAIPNGDDELQALRPN